MMVIGMHFHLITHSYMCRSGATLVAGETRNSSLSRGYVPLQIKCAKICGDSMTIHRKYGRNGEETRTSSTSHQNKKREQETRERERDVNSSN